MGYGPPQTEVKSISMVTHLPLISSSVQLVAHDVMWWWKSFAFGIELQSSRPHKHMCNCVIVQSSRGQTLARCTTDPFLRLFVLSVAAAWAAAHNQAPCTSNTWIDWACVYTSWAPLNCNTDNTDASCCKFWGACMHAGWNCTSWLSRMSHWSTVRGLLWQSTRMMVNYWQVNRNCWQVNGNNSVYIKLC